MGVALVCSADVVYLFICHGDIKGTDDFSPLIPCLHLLCDICKLSDGYFTSHFTVNPNTKHTFGTSA